MLADGPSLRLLPRLDDTNRFFWTGGADGVLRFLRCGDCRRFTHPPVPRCPTCLSRDMAPEPVSGRGTLHSFTVNHQQWIPGSDPYVVALVAIAEQASLRFTTNLIACADEAIAIGLAVEVTFAEHGGVWVPLFRPAGL